MASSAYAPRGGRGRTLIPNIILSIATILVLFVSAELVTRRLLPVANLGNVMQFDPELGWSLIPGSSKHTVDHDRDIDYVITVNSLGMQERESNPFPARGTRRLLFLGDSVAFGTGVGQDWRFTDRMARVVTTDVEVVNAAVPGWGTDQELLYYETMGRDLDPDIVVVTFFMPNDVINNSLDHLYLGTAPKPRFVLDGDSLTLEGVVRPRVEHQHQLRNLLRKSQFLRMVKRRLSPPPRDESNQRIVPTGFHPGQGRISHWSVFDMEEAEEMEGAWRTTEAILERFADDCRRDSVRLVVFVFPSIESDAEWRDRVVHDAGMHDARLDFDAPYLRLARVCRRLDIDFVYPVEAFRDESRSRTLFFEKDGHPNANGHALAAQTLIEWLHDHHHVQYAGEHAGP